ncbi:MAG TPA: S9 family peptidase, partial [Polyangiaceae bacterium]|nr:S9 family peptidase [Polyangiaceae bacterium]
MLRALRASVLVALATAAAACGGGTAAPGPPASAPPVAAKPSAAAPVAAAPPLPYPATRRVDAVEQRFGLTIRDPYRWLEDGKSPEVQAWVAAQDKLARDYLATLPGRDAIAERIAAIAYRESVSPPVKRGGRAFFSRKDAKAEKRKVYWRQGEKGEERVLLDPDAMEGGKHVGLGFWAPSYDGKSVAYVAHPDNADAGFVRVKDVASGRESAVDVIGGAKYARPLWTPKGDGFYYVGLPTDPSIAPDQLPGHSEVKFHRLGTPAAADEVAFPKTGNPETELAAKLSRDGRWLLVSVLRGASVIELHCRDLRRPGAPWVALVKGHDGVMDAVAWKDQIYLRTSEGAPNGRVFRVDPARPARAAWREIVPEDKGAALEDAAVLGGRLVLTYARDAKSEFELRSLDGARQGKGPIALPGVGSSYGVFGEPDDETAYYPFSSFTTPGAIYELALKTGESKLWYASRAPVDPAAYETEQAFYPSKDGTKVSLFVVRRKGAPKDGSTPFLLTGYGGFGFNMTPGFGEAQYVWLELGGGVALPNLRGGAEY